jgi:hypothetical protein
MERKAVNIAEAARMLGLHPPHGSGDGRGRPAVLRPGRETLADPGQGVGPLPRTAQGVTP